MYVSGSMWNLVFFGMSKLNKSVHISIFVRHGLKVTQVARNISKQFSLSPKRVWVKASGIRRTNLERSN